MNQRNSDKFGAQVGVVLERCIYPDSQGQYLLKHEMGNMIQGIQKIFPISNVEKVEEFHRVFNHAINYKPIDLSIEANKEMMYRRLGYLREELKEMDDAICEGNIIALADVFADMEYFLHGGVVEAGLKEVQEDVFAEVHRSNMSKVCDSRELASETMRIWKMDHMTPCHTEEHEGYFIVKRDEDNKVLKSCVYSPPNIKKVIEDYDKWLENKQSKE